MLSRIEPRLPLLTGGPRDAPARLQTMRDAIAWSHKLISVDEQVLFRRLGVFVGGFSLEAAEAVTDCAGPALDGIAVLVGSSLLRQEAASGSIPNPDAETSPRFGMLETVREFALEQLAASGEADLIRGRHAAWYLELAEESEMITREGPDQARCLARFEADLPNLRQALGWFEETGNTEATLRVAGALCGLWFHRSHREGSAWLERALAAADATPTAGRAKALRALALLGLSLGSTHAAEHAAESAAMWTELGDVWRAAEARMLLGQILEYRTDYARAIPLLEESAREWDAMGDPGRAAVALYFLGQAALDHEDGSRAEASVRGGARSVPPGWLCMVGFPLPAPTRGGGRHAGRPDGGRHLLRGKLGRSRTR